MQISLWSPGMGHACGEGRGRVHKPTGEFSVYTHMWVFLGRVSIAFLGFLRGHDLRRCGTIDI